MLTVKKAGVNRFLQAGATFSDTSPVEDEADLAFVYIYARPGEQNHHPLTHERSSVGARPSSAAPVDQNQHPLTHERSSVGAHPSSAAPLGQ